MKLIFTVLGISFLFASYSQIAGNEMYGNSIYGNGNYNYNYQQPVIQRNTIQSTDSTLFISGSVLLNKAADYYLISVGVGQEGKTVVECNNTINGRIDRLKAAFSKSGISDKDIYVDFISQIRIYDHKIDNNTITEFHDGFLIKKNIIIKTTDIDKIEDIIEICSKEEVFDVIQVEYVNNNVDGVYDQLFDEVYKIIEKKKARFLKGSSVDLTGKYRVVTDHFYSYNPKNMYKVYTAAFETSMVNTYYSSSYVKKEERKDRTFYYAGAQNSIGVDKIIDDITPLIGIQYVLNMTIIYEIKR